MRLGEIQNILDYAISEDNQIVYKPENLYGGQRFLIENYDDLIKALKVLSTQPWLKVDMSFINALINEHGETARKLEVSLEIHQKLSDAINNINQFLPLYYGILEQIVLPQKEEVINIKIPASKMKDLKSLNQLNNSIEEVFKLILKHKGLRGNVEFIGFDVGTSWYQFLIIGGPLIYSAFLGIIEIAKQSVELRSAWYKSEETRYAAEINKARLNELQVDESKKSLSDAEFKEFISEMLDKKIEYDVKNLINKLPDGINNEHEMEAALISGLKKATKLMEDGVEIHPSLNLPEYIHHSSEGFSIDYDSLKTIIEDKDAVAEIEAPVKNEPTPIKKEQSTDGE